MRSNLHQLIYALSDALDLVGVDDVNHGKRVAYMALECAKEMGLDDDKRVDLFHASLLHDCGVSSTRIHDKLVFTLDWQGAEDHCIRGYQLLNRTAKLRHLSNAILFHHTHYNMLEELGVDSETSLMSNLIFMADRADALHAQFRVADPDATQLSIGGKIREEIERLSGSFFNPQLVDAFLRASSREGFWFTLEPEPLHRYLLAYLEGLSAENVDMSELHEVAEMFALFVDAKSPYTADHSYDVAQLARFIAKKMQLSPDICSKIEVAGLLHDLGKLRIPDELLEKASALSPGEFDTIKLHAYETKQILSQIEGLEDIALWASQHHELLNGRGYPYHAASGEMPLPSRIIAVADVFQALAQNRPYRKGLKPMEIFTILEAKVKEGGFDGDVVATVRNNLQECWELSVANSFNSTTSR